MAKKALAQKKGRYASLLKYLPSFKQLLALIRLIIDIWKLAK